MCGAFYNNREFLIELKDLFGAPEIDFSVQDSIAAFLERSGFKTFIVGENICAYKHPDGCPDELILAKVVKNKDLETVRYKDGKLLPFNDMIYEAKGPGEVNGD